MIKRRYIYEDTYNEVMEWARQQNFDSPNRKDNFPFYLQQYINHLKFLAR